MRKEQNQKDYYEALEAAGGCADDVKAQNEKDTSDLRDLKELLSSIKNLVSAQYEAYDKISLGGIVLKDLSYSKLEGKISDSHLAAIEAAKSWGGVNVSSVTYKVVYGAMTKTELINQQAKILDASIKLLKASFWESAEKAVVGDLGTDSSGESLSFSQMLSGLAKGFDKLGALKNLFDDDSSEKLLEQPSYAAALPSSNTGDGTKTDVSLGGNGAWEMLKTLTKVLTDIPPLLEGFGNIFQNPEALLEDVLITEYIVSDFNNASMQFSGKSVQRLTSEPLDPKSNRGTEVEYIINGNAVSGGVSVILQVFLLRLALNFIATFTIPQVNTVASSAMAIPFLGWVAGPVIRIGLAVIETLIDMIMLISSGDKVPLYKTARSWYAGGGNFNEIIEKLGKVTTKDLKLDLPSNPSAAKATLKTPTGTGNKKLCPCALADAPADKCAPKATPLLDGLKVSYKDHLRLFTLLATIAHPDEVLLRTADVIQVHMAEKNSNFRMRNAYTHLQVDAQYRVKPVLVKLFDNSEWMPSSGRTGVFSDAGYGFSHTTVAGY
jgi:hypothetical protein